MSDFKEDVQYSHIAPPIAGSIFINNTSYSGADIKILVTLYDKGAEKKAYMQQQQQDINAARSNIEELKRAIAHDQYKIERVKAGSIEHEKILAHALKLQHSYINALQILKYLLDEQTDMASNKTLGNGPSTKVLAEAQTLSVSTHRDKRAVRSCGSVYPKGFTRGPRQIAGSIVFTVFDEHVLWNLLESHPADYDANNASPAILDQLPPVDILISFANEYGSISRMTIHGVEFIDEGTSMSIEDIMTENTVSWVARDIDPMRAVSSRWNASDALSGQLGNSQPKRASDLLLEDDFQTIKNSSNPFTRQRKRRDPFL